MEEFDKLINHYMNAGLEKLNFGQKINGFIKSILEGFSSIGIYKTKSFKDCINEIDLRLYGQTGLNETQKSAINIASAWKQTEKRLEKIILGKIENELPIEEAKKGKLLAQDIYETYRNIYYHH